MASNNSNSNNSSPKEKTEYQPVVIEDGFQYVKIVPKKAAPAPEPVVQGYFVGRRIDRWGNDD